MNFRIPQDSAQLGGPATNQNPGTSGSDFSVRYDFITKASNTITLTDSINQNAAGTFAQNCLSVQNSSGMHPFGHDPAGGVQLNARLVSHHSNRADGVGCSGATKFTPNYLFADSRVANLDTNETFEGPTGPFNYQDTMWDADQR